MHQYNFGTNPHSTHHHTYRTSNLAPLKLLRTIEFRSPRTTRRKVPRVTCYFHPVILPKIVFRQALAPAAFQASTFSDSCPTTETPKRFGGGVCCRSGHPRRPCLNPVLFTGAAVRQVVVEPPPRRRRPLQRDGYRGISKPEVFATLGVGQRISGNFSRGYTTSNSEKYFETQFSFVHHSKYTFADTNKKQKLFL